MENAISIIRFILQSLLSIWPYLVITIPLAVAVQVTGIAGYLNRTFSKRPFLAILLATLAGAFSPLCSCSVVPLIATMLIGGVPLAPVMSFWIASPSMDPELIPLSIATIGWELSLWRIGSSLVISLVAGFATHLAVRRGVLGNDFLLNNSGSPTGKQSLSRLVLRFIGKKLRQVQYVFVSSPRLAVQIKTVGGSMVNCCLPEKSILLQQELLYEKKDPCISCSMPPKENIYGRILRQTWESTFMILKYMLLAFLINGVINIYVPQDYLTPLLHNQKWYSVILATLIGIPTYTSNLLALPLIGGFLEMGMNPAAALAFLLAGPVTTIPAMVAVWGIVKKKVFFLYLMFAITGAMLSGLLYLLF